MPPKARKTKSPAPRQQNRVGGSKSVESPSEAPVVAPAKRRGRKCGCVFITVVVLTCIALAAGIGAHQFGVIIDVDLPPFDLPVLITDIQQYIMPKPSTATTAGSCITKEYTGAQPKLVKALLSKLRFSEKKRGRMVGVTYDGAVSALLDAQFGIVDAFSSPACIRVVEITAEQGATVENLAAAIERETDKGLWVLFVVRGAQTLSKATQSALKSLLENGDLAGRNVVHTPTVLLVQHEGEMKRIFDDRVLRMFESLEVY